MFLNKWQLVPHLVVDKNSNTWQLFRHVVDTFASSSQISFLIDGYLLDGFHSVSLWMYVGITFVYYHIWQEFFILKAFTNGWKFTGFTLSKLLFVTSLGDLKISGRMINYRLFSGNLISPFRLTGYPPSPEKNVSLIRTLTNHRGHNILTPGSLYLYAALNCFFGFSSIYFLAQNYK